MSHRKYEYIHQVLYKGLLGYTILTIGYLCIAVAFHIALISFW